MNQSIMKGIHQVYPLIAGKKFLLVRDQSYKQLYIKSVFDTFPHVEFSDFTPNPLYAQVCKGVELFNREKCDIIVAVGGGSAIDVAKCIKLFCRMDRNINYLKQPLLDTGIELIAIPTTAGTGSESTRHAVIYYEGMKQSISHESIVPDYAVLEPIVLKTLPIYQKKCTMLDALCQAIESWWSVKSTIESKEYSMKAVTAIKENWEKYIFDNEDTAADKIMEAANYAGRAINITATTAAHAMSYKITSLYKFPHGHAVAICLPEVWRYITNHIDDCADPRGKKYLNETLMEISELISITYFKYMLEVLEMKHPISEDKNKDLEDLVRSVNTERLNNSPIAFRPGTVKNMYRRVLHT